MIYGLYLSATGVLTNSYRQDVIANNLANAETVGFKRSLALFQQRRVASRESGSQGMSGVSIGGSDSTASLGHASGDPLLDGIGGGILVAPTYVDYSQGPIEATSSPLDVAIHGRGYYAVQDGNNVRLTRNGRFMVDRTGYLILADGSDHRVLDANQKPISLEGLAESQITVQPDGTISNGKDQLARLGLFDVPDETQLKQLGGTLLGYSGDTTKLAPGTGSMQSGYIENSNVDPTTELTQLITAQRQLEANANMIRYQDQTLGLAVNSVGKIS